MTYTDRSLRALREQGYLCTLVPSGFLVFDLFDLLAIHAQSAGVLGVQVMSWDSIVAGCAKALAQPALAVWLKAGNRVELHGWGTDDFRVQTLVIEHVREHERALEKAEAIRPYTAFPVREHPVSD